MTISIDKSKTDKFTKEAKDELKNQLTEVANDICDEAGKLEANRCNSMTQIQITPRTVKKAAEQVIEFGVPKKIKTHWFIAFVLPFINTVSTIGINLGIRFYDKNWGLAILSVSILVLVLVLLGNIVYFINQNK